MRAGRPRPGPSEASRRPRQCPAPGGPTPPRDRPWPFCRPPSRSILPGDLPRWRRAGSGDEEHRAVADRLPVEHLEVQAERPPLGLEDVVLDEAVRSPGRAEILPELVAV